MTDIFAKLLAPFEPSRVSWRVGSTNKEKTKAMALAYIDARDVMNRLDEAVGPAKWADTYQYHGETAICNLSICIDSVWVSKADGAGDTQVEAEKGRISDAFKRAAVKWGVGRYLYDLDSPWVEIEQRGNSYVIKKSEMEKLKSLLDKNYKPSGRMADDPAVQEEYKSQGIDVKKQADDMIEIINNQENESECKAWREANRTIVNKLPTEQKKRVMVAYDVRLGEVLSKQQGVQ